VRAEKKKSRLPQTPHNLSIHKDMSQDHDDDDGDVYQMKEVQACPVVNSDQGDEVLMGELAFTIVVVVVVVVVCIRSHSWSARQRHHRLQSVV